MTTREVAVRQEIDDTGLTAELDVCDECGRGADEPGLGGLVRYEADETDTEALHYHRHCLSRAHGITTPTPPSVAEYSEYDLALAFTFSEFLVLCWSIMWAMLGLSWTSVSGPGLWVLSPANVAVIIVVVSVAVFLTTLQAAREGARKPRQALNDE